VGWVGWGGGARKARPPGHWRWHQTGAAPRVPPSPAPGLLPARQRAALEPPSLHSTRAAAWFGGAGGLGTAGGGDTFFKTQPLFFFLCFWPGG
jgi:hypothetical protein